MRQSWTDDRLDSLNEKVDRGFEQVDKRFEQVDKRFEKVEDRIESLGKEIHARFDTLQKMMLQASVLLIVALIGVIATQL